MVRIDEQQKRKILKNFTEKTSFGGVLMEKNLCTYYVDVHYIVLKKYINRRWTNTLCI